MNLIKFKIYHLYDKTNYFVAVIPLKKTFDDLMSMILKEFDWDDDHPYSIYCSYAGTTQNTRLKNSVVFSCLDPWEDEESTSEYLDSITWERIKNVYVNFDYGDDHWFGCKIMGLESGKNKIVILKHLDKKLRQYPNEYE
jgi:hypothetical protein